MDKIKDILLALSALIGSVASLFMAIAAYKKVTRRETPNGQNPPLNWGKIGIVIFATVNLLTLLFLWYLAFKVPQQPLTNVNAFLFSIFTVNAISFMVIRRT